MNKRQQEIELRSSLTQIWPASIILLFLFALAAGCSLAHEHLNRGVQLEREGKLEAAIAEYSRAIEKRPDDALGYFNRACAEKKRGDLKSAAADFSRAIELNAALADAHLGRGRIRLSQGEYTGAISDFSRTIELDSEQAEAYLGRGIAYMETGVYERAMSDLDKAIAIDPYSVPAFTSRGELKARMDNLRAALSDYERAIRIDPDYAVAYYNSGVARERIGDYSRAIEDYQRAASLSSKLNSPAARRIEFCRSLLSTAMLAPASGKQESAGLGNSALPAKGPADLSLEWKDASGESPDLDLSKILAKANKIRGLKSLVIIQHSRLITEAYFEDNSRHILNPVRSVTKSVLSLLVGIALREGLIRSLDQPLSDFFKNVPEQAAEKLQRTTIRHLLLAGAGMDWEESAGGEYRNGIRSSEPADHGDDFELDYTDELLGFYASVDELFVYKFGNVFTRTSGAADLLSAALAQAAGISTLDFADRYLFKPLGIIKRRWQTVGRGGSNGSADLFLRPLDMAKLGQLVVQKGASAEKEIVPSSWIDESLKVHQSIRGKRHGFLWGLETWSSRSAALAMGFGGQFIVCLPEQELVIVTTGAFMPQDTPRNRMDQTNGILHFIRRDIIPALLKAA